MGRKMPPSPGLTKGKLQEGVAGSSSSSSWTAASGGTNAGRLVERIAEALEMSPASIYEAVLSEGALSRATEGGTVVGAGLDNECATLLQAYRMITDPEERRLFLKLVQAAAERN